jgi:hypothetical protein
MSGQLSCIPGPYAHRSHQPSSADGLRRDEDLRMLEDLAAIVMNDLEQRLLSRDSA